MVHSNRLFSVVSIALLLFFALASFVFEGMQQTALWIAVPSAAVFAYFAVPNRQISPYLKLQIALYLWIAFTALFAFDLGLAKDQLKRIVGCILMIYAINQLGKDNKLIPWLYIVYLVFYLGMVYYARTHILTDNYDYTSQRLGDDVLNANMIAYFTFFTTFIVYIMADMTKKKFVSNLFRVLFVLSPVWSFAIAILTASRQVIVVQVPLILLLLYVRYIYIKNRLPMTKLVYLIVGIAMGVFFIVKGNLYYEDSTLSQRNELAIDDDARTVHLRRAFEVGITHPIIGVGPGCYGIYGTGKYTFSHNNYAELFANCGLPALLLCIIIYCKFIKTQWKRYKKTKDYMFLVFLIFGVMYVVDNMFYVFYTAPWLMAFFFLVAMHSENFYELNYGIYDGDSQLSLKEVKHE